MERLNTTADMRLILETAIAAAFLFASLPGGVQAQTPTPDSNRVYDAGYFEGLQYRMVGPTRGGRVTTVAGHRAHPRTFYMGSTGGGVWKTTDAGGTWRNVSDGSDFTTASMGAIRVAPSDTNVVYAGTGTDGLRSNIITGRGLFKSADAGASWDFMGLEETGQIGAVEVHPEDPDRVYVAALGHPFGKNEARGVFRSSDGGASWEKVLYASDSTGAIDLELHPTDPSTIYAAMWRGERKPWTIISGCAAPCGDGVWKSTDGGDHWQQVLSGEDMPEGLIGKVDLAVSPDAPDRVYALVEAKPSAEGLYRSDDRGESWELVNTRPELMARPFYYTNVNADPTDADVVYVNGSVGEFSRSADAGETFERIRTPHGDNHDLWINPDDSDIMIQSNDGGANVTLDGGETWSAQDNQPTAELYQVDVDDQFPYWLYAGQQDNSTIMVPSLPPAESAPTGPEGWWKAVGGCETGPAVPKPGEASVVYANCKGRFGRYNSETGQEKQYAVGAQYMYGRNPAELEYRFQRTVPIEVSPYDPDIVYHGSQYLHRTTDEGATWEQISPDLTANRPARQVASGRPITRDITGEEHYSTLYVVEASPHEAGTIWTGANDGPVHVTRDGGDTWTDVTPPDMPPEGRINAIEISPHDPAKAYVAGYRYLLDDWRPYLYETEDYGASWTLLTDGTNGILADDPTRVVREDPEREGLLYAGTEFGMFISFDDGAHWQPFQQNLPVTPITDIEVHAGDLVLATMGRSFWILDALGPVRQLDPKITSAEAHLFQPRDAYRMRYRSHGQVPSAPQYLPPGAIIDYYFAEAPKGEMTLEILDDSGAVVRSFASKAPVVDSAQADSASADSTQGEERSSMHTSRRAASAAFSRAVYLTDSLSAAAGMHRFIWDGRYPGPWSKDGGDGGGPLAVPGAYQVRLTTGDWQQTRPLQLKIDPRVEADGVTGADLEDQLALNLKIRDALSEAREAAAAMDSARQDVEQSVEKGEQTEDEAASARANLDRMERVLVTAEEGSYPPPMLIDQLGYLYGITTQADQKPGQDAYARYEELRGQLEEALRQWAEMKPRVTSGAPAADPSARSDAR